MNEVNSYTEVAVNSATTDFTVGFKYYEDRDKINVFLNDVDITTLGYTITQINSTLLRVSPAITSGTVRLQRETSIDKNVHNYSAGAHFTASSVDENFEQVRHSQQEVRDRNTFFENGVNKTIDGFSGLVQDVQAEFGAVRAIADEAGRASANAEAEALNALNVANGIDSKATEALGNSTEALNTANGIAGTAANAFNTASSANQTASNALNVANGIDGKAQSALDTANQASQTANQAVDTAEQALEQTTLRPATVDRLGGLKVGAGLDIDAEGVLRVKDVGVPLGSPIWFNGVRSRIDTGYVPYDGQILSRATFPELWARVQAKFNIISDSEWLANPSKRAYYSTGNDTTTFRMPDLNGVVSGSYQGLFLRGDGNGSITGELVSTGTVLGDAIRNITGYWGDTRNNYATPTGAFSKFSSGSSAGSGSTANASFGFNFDASRVVPVANENRPVSAVGVWICRAGSAEVTVLNPTNAAALTGGNVFSGAQTIIGNLNASNLFLRQGTNLSSGENYVQVPVFNSVVYCRETSSGVTIARSTNIESVSRTGVGRVQVTFNTPQKNTDYMVFITLLAGDGANYYKVDGAVAKTVNGFGIVVFNSSGVQDGWELSIGVV